MNDDYERLQLQTKKKYVLDTFRNGLRCIQDDSKVAQKFVFLCLALAVVALFFASGSSGNDVLSVVFRPIIYTTGRDKEGKAAISVITNKLLAIGRLGRALGIHLLVATQRPDVGSVPGSLKAQLDGRICGHTADAQSSIVILDDGSAANLPAIPGRFIIRNGSETDDIVQAYYYHK